MSEAFSLPHQRKAAAQMPPAMLDLFRVQPHLGVAPGRLGHHLQPIDGAPGASLEGHLSRVRAVRVQRRQAPEALWASRLVPSFRSGWVIPLNKAYLSLLCVQLAPQFLEQREARRESHERAALRGAVVGGGSETALRVSR